MNAETKRKLEQLDREMLYVRNEAKELTTFGWKSFDPLQQYDNLKAELADVENAIHLLPADKTKDMEKLVTRENVLVESVQNAAQEAGAELKREQMKFFDARDKFTAPLEDEITKADAVLKQSLTKTFEALQKRWQAMGRKKRIFDMLAFISNRYHTTPQIGGWDVRLPKPFSKKDLNNWQAYILTFFERTNSVLSNNGESAVPDDLARVVYE